MFGKHGIPLGIVPHRPMVTYLQRLVENALHAGDGRGSASQSIGCASRGRRCHIASDEDRHSHSHSVPKTASQASSNGGRAVTAFLKPTSRDILEDELRGADPAIGAGEAAHMMGTNIVVSRESASGNTSALSVRNAQGVGEQRHGEGGTHRRTLGNG